MTDVRHHLPHDTCPVCGRTVAVRVNGALRAHGPGYPMEFCPGSGRPAR